MAAISTDPDFSEIYDNLSVGQLRMAPYSWKFLVFHSEMALITQADARLDCTC